MQHFRMIFAGVLICGAICLEHAALAQTNRIVCIGDSITQGCDETWAPGAVFSYRYVLWKRLIDAGVAFDFVGSIDYNYPGDEYPAYLSYSPRYNNYPDYKGHEFDRDHEGHWNYRADEMMNALPGWLEGYDADIALIHLGSNDQYQSDTTGYSGAHTHAATSNDLGAVIGHLRSDNPNIKILLCQIMPWRGRTNIIHDLNVNYIAPLALAETTEQSPVILVDQYTGYQDSWIMSDTAHPSDEGEAFMAKQFYEALRPLLIGLVDEDGDGMHDQWEIDYFGDLAHSETNNTDGDAYTDSAEYVLGTDPTNALSKLNFSGESFGSNLFRLTFNTVSGRQYRLESAAALSNLSWSVSVSTNASGGVMNLEQSVPDTNRYFRVKVDQL